MDLLAQQASTDKNTTSYSSKYYTKAITKIDRISITKIDRIILNIYENLSGRLIFQTIKNLKPSGNNDLYIPTINTFAYLAILETYYSQYYYLVREYRARTRCLDYSK